MKRLNIIVSGRVQGVGFRYFTQSIASSLGLTGWVKNLPNGQVEIEVQGDKELLNEFKKRISKGPSLARVDNIVEKEIPVQGGESTFSIRY